MDDHISDQNHLACELNGGMLQQEAYNYLAHDALASTSQNLFSFIELNLFTYDQLKGLQSSSKIYDILCLAISQKQNTQLAADFV